ncbi:MAG: 30S ribosomal protein S6 [Chlamydiota bacterium]
MKKQHPRLYEGMFILNASLSEDAMKKALEKISGAIEERGGEIHKVHDWGRKKLAYEINNYKQGHYFLLYFSVVSSALAEMNAEYLLNEDLIRYQTLKADAVMEKIEFKPLPES